MQLDLGREPVLLDWLAQACKDVAVEPVVDAQGFALGYQVLVTNGVDGEGREEAVMASCDGQNEAELVAAALWALARRWTADE
jgi:hypothetical protein